MTSQTECVGRAASTRLKGPLCWDPPDPVQSRTQPMQRWLKRMLSALNGSVNTEYTFHGTRAVATLVALANDRSIEQINKQQGWRARSDMCNRYARLQQVQYLAQQPVLRESLADTLAVDHAAFFKQGSLIDSP